jgi:hypothetical protein
LWEVKHRKKRGGLRRLQHRKMNINQSDSCQAMFIFSFPNYLCRGLSIPFFPRNGWMFSHSVGGRQRQGLSGLLKASASGDGVVGVFCVFLFIRQLCGSKKGDAGNCAAEDRIHARPRPLMVRNFFPLVQNY